MPLVWNVIENQETPTGPAPNLKVWLRTERARVLGGWLVRSIVMHREMNQATGGQPDIDADMAVGLTFVPDAANAWNL